jgi:2-hydroxy-4-carboxymuconate semialdehyde hemiacetal dehydrogenase
MKVRKEAENMKVGVAGQGAFGVKHIEAIQNIPGIEIITLSGGNQAATEEVAKKFKIPHWTGDLGESLKQPGLEAVILATPTQMHADQAVQCLKAGVHVQVEIPMADSLADSERILKAQKETGLIAMAGHTRRFNPSHQWIHKRVKSGEFKVQQMNVQTYFFRRTNMNAAGKPRSWTDHLLWHHACHTVDLFAYQTGENISECFALEGPHHPELKIAMDMSIGLKVPSGAICTLSLSFNNKGPQGTFFRYIGDSGTYVAYYDDLVDGEQNKIDLSKVDVSMNGIELQDREFFAAIEEKREPNSSVQQTISAMRVLDRLEQMLESKVGISA